MAMAEAIDDAEPVIIQPWAEGASPLTLFAGEGDTGESVVLFAAESGRLADIDNDRVLDDQESRGCAVKSDCDDDGLDDGIERYALGAFDHDADSDGGGLSDKAGVNGYQGKYTNPLSFNNLSTGKPTTVDFQVRPKRPPVHRLDFAPFQPA